MIGQVRFPSAPATPLRVRLYKLQAASAAPASAERLPLPSAAAVAAVRPHAPARPRWWFLRVLSWGRSALVAARALEAQPPPRPRPSSAAAAALAAHQQQEQEQQQQQSGPRRRPIMPNIINDIKLDFKDVLLRPKRSTLKSRSDVDLFREITFRNSKQTYRGIPVMASNMDTVGTFEMARALSKHGLFTTIHKYYTIDEWKEFAIQNPECLRNMAASSGTGNEDFDRLKNVLAAIPELLFICIDVANGYSQHFVEYVRKVRSQFPQHTIIAGNVVTGEMVEELILSGADVIKVGIGPGSVCTTRMKTGVGYPQLSAVIECADAAHGLKGHIISDGGCTCPGDIAKAFGAGADFVMAGGMFAGHDECGGETIEKEGKKFKLFYGMASSTAMKKHAGGVADYRSSEGKTVEVPYRGKVESTVLDMLGGLRSACTYVGASHLRELPKRATFVRCTQQLNNIYGPPM